MNTRPSSLSTTSSTISPTVLCLSPTLEITPFAMRAKVLALMNFFVSCSLIFNQYVNTQALDGIGWKYYLVYLGWLIFESFFVWKFVIETKNLTLEETSRLFDGTDAVDEIVFPTSTEKLPSGRKDGLDERKS
ncbi:hypothetical protein BDY24DRAFT_47412 [Mrakia frigida]|uniref:uncharacterized protein n=1 Tax=Mrakia frigida TaxID=29902 RepID=UPI003FCBFF21